MSSRRLLDISGRGRGRGRVRTTVADRVISIDQIHSSWPDTINLLESWGFSASDPELVELADVHLNFGGGSGGGYGYYDGSDTARAARDLLASDDEFRNSVDAFYAQDFSCFGFQKGQEVLGVSAVQKTPRQQQPPPPTVTPTVDQAPDNLDKPDDAPRDGGD